MNLTKRERQFCDLYSRYGGNYHLICRDMGIGISAYKSYLRKDSVKEYLACAMQRAKDSLVAALPSITDGLIQMYNNPDIDPKVKVQIASQILDRAGLVTAPKDVNLNVSINTSISDRARELMRERITIETTATPVSPTPALAQNGDNIIGRKVSDESVEQAVSRQELT